MKRILIFLAIVIGISGIWILLDDNDEKKAEQQDIQIWYPNGYELLLKKDLNDVEVIRQLEEEMNIPLFFYCVNGDIDSQFQTLMADWGENDVVFYKFSEEQLESSYENGQILDYTPYLDQMPNLRKLFAEYPEIYQKACVNGRCLRLPSLKWNAYEDKVFAVRTDWKQQSGIDQINNLEDLRTMLSEQRELFDQQKLINQGDYFAGLSSYGGYVDMLQMIFHTYDGIYWDEDKENLVYGPQTEEYRNYLIYMKNLYQTKTLDAHLYEEESINFEKYFLNNQSSVLLAPVEQEGKLEEYSQKNGDNISIEYLNPYTLQEGVPSIYSTEMREFQVLDFGFVIRGDIEEEKLIQFLRLVDYLYSPEGIERLNWGNENQHYEQDSQGRKRYKSELLSEDEYYMVDMSQYVKQDFLCMDMNANRWMLEEEQQECINAFSYIEDYSFIEPTGYYEEDEEELVGELKSSLTTYVDEMTMKFIYDSADPADDDQWEAYLQALDRFGVSRYLEIQKNGWTNMQETIYG